VVHEALQKFASVVRSRFGARLRELTLFGSRARGTATTESDVDVLVVVQGLTGAEGRELGYLAGDLLTEFGVLISPLALTPERIEHLRAGRRLLAQDIARDGVAL
jgi:predicted nucleotidyltransferase